MSRFLFALWEGGGNVAPVLSVARALVERGHAVRVLCDPVLEPDVAAVGAVPRVWATAPSRRDRTVASEFVRDFEARTPFGRMAALRERLVIGPAGAYAADTLAELDREPADAVVSEMLVAGSQLAARAAGVPSVVLVPNVYPLDLPGRPPFGMGLQPMAGPAGRLRDRAVSAASRRLWDRGLAQVNRLRAQHGLPPLAGVLDTFDEADAILVLTCAAFDVGPAYTPPPSVRYCGPRLDDPSWAAGGWRPTADRPLVLVSLSTTFQRHAGMLGRVAQALGRLPVQGLITTGPSITPAEVAAPPNVDVVESAPHAALLPRTAAVITHAGHGTTIKALAHGVPVVCLPVSRDQPDTAARVVAAGAGLRLRPTASPRRIAEATRRVLDEPSFASGARRIADAIAADRVEDRAVIELERVCAPLAG